MSIHARPNGKDADGTVDEYLRRFEALEKLILERAPPSRQRSLALTKLEEANLWLNEALCVPWPTAAGAATALPEISAQPV